MGRKITLWSSDPAGKTIKRRDHLIRRDIARRVHPITDDGKVNSFHNFFSFGVVLVRYGKPSFLPALHQIIREELLLAFKVLFQGLMIIEMVRGKICEDRTIKLASKHAFEVKPMGGDFHNDMRGSLFMHLPQNFL